METIKGIDRLISNLSSNLDRAIDESAQMIGLEIVDRILTYPAETEANNPSNPTGRWYKRGTGGFYRRKRDGRSVQTSSSETLGGHWAVERRRGSAQVLNLASYAPFVHKKSKQAGFHGERGWLTDEDVIEEIANDNEVLEDVKSHIVKALGF